MIFAVDEIASEAQPLPRNWARLIQKLRWIGLDDEAARTKDVSWVFAPRIPIEIK